MSYAERDRADQAADPDPGSGLVESADRDEPAGILTARRVADQGARDGKQGAPDDEQYPPHARTRGPTQRERRPGDAERNHEARHACLADRRAEQGPDRPARVVGEGASDRGEHAGLRDGGEPGPGRSDRQGRAEPEGSVRLARTGENDERKGRATERQRLADEPRRAQPQQDEGDHDAANTNTWAILSVDCKHPARLLSHTGRSPGRAPPAT